MRREGFGKDALCVALAANSYTDIFQEEAVEWVIDDDFCEASKLLVEFLHFDGLPDKQTVDRYWRQLIHNTHGALAEKVRTNDRLGALMVMGITLHIVQDFYAHSNWVELDIPRRAGVRDATYFDLSAERLEGLLPGAMVWARSGLFTHWAGGLSHDALHKDHAGKPYFDQAYRCAYKASLQWLRLMRKWVVDDLRRPDFWNELQRYQFTGNRRHLYTLTEFDEGTIRWLCTYGGAWKTPHQWSNTDMAADDMPNVPGIGVAEQASPDYPFLGIEWFANCALVAQGMFEVRLRPGGARTFAKLTRVENLENALRHSSDFGETVRVIHSEVPPLPPLDTPVIRDAFTVLARSTQDDYPQVRWLRVRVPEAMDLDTGAGWDNVNNEEIGGASDYWVMFIVNGEAEHPYTEAEYVDTSHSYPVWGVLKPLWERRPVRVQIRMFESDPTNHKDEEMDVAPGSPKAFTFEFDPETGSYGAIAGYQLWRIPRGYFLKSDGAGDLRARIYVKIWMMEDFP
ncbi:MAG: HET-C-related protein [Armatimonadota bacterium]|nr:HET-C-related protein [Armatimonadota bacterium]